MTSTEKIGELFDRLIGEGRDRGLQFAALREGEPMVEVCAGTLSAAGEPVTPETLFPVFSATKGVMATLLLIARSRGLIDYDRPLADYWPEFAGGGRDQITMRMALNHTAGLPQLPSFPPELMPEDFPAMAAAMCRERPLWEPGTDCFYHAISFSFLTLEPLRRVTGKEFNQLVEEWILPHLPVAGGRCCCGTRLTEGIATIEPNDQPAALEETVPVTPDPRAELAIPAYARPLESWINRPETLRATLPASTGVMNARFLAGMYFALGTGKLVPMELVKEAREVRMPGVPPERRRNFNFGFCLSDDGSWLGHGGYGGSLAGFDFQGGLAYAGLKNRMNSSGAAPDARALLREA